MYKEADAIVLFTAYNQKISNVFDRLVDDIDPKQADSPDFYTQLRNATMNSMQNWYREPIEALNGQTAEAVVDQLQGIDELLAFTKIGARYCDEELPDVLKIRLGREAAGLLPGLREIALQVGYERGETTDSVLEAVMAIRLLGEWQDLPFAKLFIEQFVTAPEPQELITDAGQYYFEQLGQAGLDELQQVLIDFHRSNEAYTSAYEYLLVFLTQLGIKFKASDIYPLLRTAFRSQERKVISAICIGDYGDPRGIVLLRNYIIEHEQELDRQLYYESISSIKRLGGDTKDLPDPFRDFSSDKGSHFPPLF